MVAQFTLKFSQVAKSETKTALNVEVKCIYKGIFLALSSLALACPSVYEFRVTNYFIYIVKASKPTGNCSAE